MGALIQQKLAEYLGRTPSVEETTNAMNDPVILMRILTDVIKNLEARTSVIEGKLLIPSTNLI